jgi:PKD repeat protein
MSWSYALNGEYTSLVMDLGQDGEATLRVLGDDKLLYDSGQLPTKGHLTAVVDLRGVTQLQIAVVDVTAGVPWNDRVVIGSPVLITEPVKSAADMPGKGGSTPPQAKITCTPANGAVPLDVAFSGEQSQARDGGQVGRYTWYFGDGQTETLSPNPKHTYQSPGLYDVVLQAEDDKGGVGVARQTVLVSPNENQPPIALIKPSARVVNNGEAVQFDASESSSVNGAITDYRWDFGDGQMGDGKVASHVYHSIGRYAASLTVLNKAGNQARATVSIRVTGPGEPPVFPLRKGARVLLIGNSLIGFCGPITDWLTVFDKASPQPRGIDCESIGKGLGKLVEYATWSRLAVHDKINQGWDVVIIQPWNDALDPSVSDEQLLKDCKTLVDWAREAKAYPVLYEPQFGWQNQAADQALAHQRIMRLAVQLDTGYIPAGQAWLTVAKDYPMKLPGAGRSQKETDPDTLDGLMYIDFGHQSFTGALFNSLMVWKYLTGESPLDVKVSAADKDVWDEARQRVDWDRLGYFQKVADQAIIPAAQRVR